MAVLAGSKQTQGLGICNLFYALWLALAALSGFILGRTALPPPVSAVHHQAALFPTAQPHCTANNHTATSSAADSGMELKNITRLWGNVLRHDGQALQRFWNMDNVQRAAVVSSFEQMAPVVAKLQTGGPITVAAIGSSIVGDFGGIYHPSLEAIYKLVPRPKQHLYQAQTFLGRGFLELFMKYVNDTWPHPEHILVNSGNAAMSPGAFANGDCIESLLPPNADIVIIDTMAVIDALSVEKLIWRIFSHFGLAQSPKPAVIIYNPMDVAIPPWGESCSPPGAAVAECCKIFNTSMRYHWRVEKYEPKPNTAQPHPTVTKLGAGPHHELARYYGFASLSHRDFLWQYLKSEAWRALNLPHGECELLNLVNTDTIHPTPLGQVLLADYLWAYLGTAVARAATLEAAHASGADPGGKTLGFTLDASAEQIAEFAALAANASMPRRPFQAKGRDVYQTRCYGFFGREDMAPKAAGTGNEGALRLDVIGGEGFQFFLNTTNGSAKRKPGWVATKPGASMDVAVNTLFMSGGQAVGDVDVVLTYLRSYEHMGQANVTCIAGCTCAGARVDAHRTEHVSVAELVMLRVTPAERCVVRVLVSADTSSGEHKFKVLQLAARALVQEQSTQ